MPSLRTRRVSVKVLEELPLKERLRVIRGRDTQAAFAKETGFSKRQIIRWEMGHADPTYDSALQLAERTGYPERLFLPPPEPTLGELGAKLDLILSLLESRNGRRR